MTQTERLRYEYELDTYEIDEQFYEYVEVFYGTYENLEELERQIWG